MMKIINEDGSNINDFSKHPLMIKWHILYQKQDICKQLEKCKYENYSCLHCDKCPEGSDFKISKEDLEEYKKYLKKIEEYNKIHNPKLAALMELKLKKDNN